MRSLVNDVLDYTCWLTWLGNLSTARVRSLWGEVGFPIPLSHDTRGDGNRLALWLGKKESHSDCLARWRRWPYPTRSPDRRGKVIEGFNFTQDIVDLAVASTVR